jgi:hypothetical protein
MSCPFACPLAWSDSRRITCVYGRVRVGVPAKDCPSVSLRACQRHPAGASSGGGLYVTQNDPISGGPWGVASCPLGCPLKWPARLHPPLIRCSVLPAKEGQNRQPQTRRGGGP